MAFFPQNTARLRFGIGLILAAAVSSACFWPSLFGERIWDDHFLVGDNPFFRGPALAGEAFRHWLYPFSISTYYRPVQNLSYMLDYWLWGSDLIGYHVTNVVLHASAAFLLARVFVIIGTQTRSDAGCVSEHHKEVQWTAWLSAGIWLVHPIHHAAVAYVAGRADSLAAVLALGAWLCIESWARGSSGLVRFLWCAAAILMGGLALCSKEIAICWFVLFTCYCLWLRPEWSANRRRRLIAGCWSIALIYALHRISLPSPGSQNGANIAAVGGFGERAVLVLRALGDYVSVLLCPINLHMERNLAPVGDGADYWRHLHSTLLLPIGVLALAVCVTLWLRRSPRRSFRRFAICWFVVGFLPISNIVPLNAQVAEHWIYMPSAGLVMLGVGELMVAGLLPVWGRFAILGSIFFTLGVVTNRQSRTWASEEGFFRVTIARGGNSSRARSNLARVLDQKGRLAEAETIVREALATDPDLPMLRVQLAQILRQQGKLEQAAQVIAVESKLKIRQQGTTPWLRDAVLVDAMLAAGQDAEAREFLAEAMGRNPGVWRLVRTQVMLYQKDGRPDLVINTLEEYLTREWWHGEAVVLLAQHLAAAKQFNQAVEKYELAARLDIRAVKPWEQIAAIRFQQQRFPEALEAQKRAVKRAPDSPIQRIKLAQGLEAVGEKEAAALEHSKAAKLLRAESEKRDRKLSDETLGRRVESSDATFKTLPGAE